MKNEELDRLMLNVLAMNDALPVAEIVLKATDIARRENSERVHISVAAAFIRLEVLEDQGCVSSVKRTNGMGRERVYFSITDIGRGKRIGLASSSSGSILDSLDGSSVPVTRSGAHLIVPSL